METEWPVPLGTRVYAYRAVGTIAEWRIIGNAVMFRADWSDGKFSSEWYRWHVSWLKP